MCGIAGFVDPEGRTDAPDRVLLAMRESLRHRGPDDAGSYLAPPVRFGHRRLAVVDLTPAGHQPFVWSGPQGEIAAMANAEIYNHLALKAELAAATPGLALPAGDCGMLPHLYARDGANLALRLSGMYALAVWDQASGTLVLARDPAGEKPLYWAELGGGGLAFASEPKALLAHPLVSREIDPVGVRRYFAYDFVPIAGTVYRQVRKLPAGHTLVWRAGTVRIHEHFPPPAGPAIGGRLDEAGELVWEAIARAAGRQLMADVPLGVFLSGGLDSSAVTAALKDRVARGAVKTYCIGFEDPSFDESREARRVAEHLGTTHREQRLEPREVLDRVPEILDLLDEPLADASLIPTWLLARFAREEVTVALGGDGGDELFLGYPTFAADAVAGWAARAPRLFRQAADAGLARLPVSTDDLTWTYKARRFLAGLESGPDERPVIWLGGLSPAAQHGALSRAILDAAPDAAVVDDVRRLAQAFRAARPEADRMSLVAWLTFRTYLADGVLAKVDRASMAHGLEVRAPLLDPELIELAFRLPAAWKARGFQTKRVLRRALAARLPRETVRRGKKGFGIPVARWLKGPLQGWMRSVLAPGPLAQGGVLDPVWVGRLMDEHTAGRADHRKPLWSALVFELWRRGRFGPG
jgi:asparagine synthase (glutamine-hydrolysing)